MFLINSCRGLFTATTRCLRVKPFTPSGVPSPEVTVPLCLVPSPEFSQAPWYSQPDHLCRFRVRSLHNLKLRGFSWKLGINHFTPHGSSSSGLSLKKPDLPNFSTYTLKRGQPTPRWPSLLRPPVAVMRGTGILTCFPSTTLFSLALGADSPYPD